MKLQATGVDAASAEGGGVASDAAFAALERERTYEAEPDTVRSVLEHSKSHPRMLESAFPAPQLRLVPSRAENRFAILLSYFFAAPSDVGFARLSTNTLHSLSPAHPPGNATSHVWPLGALAELLDK